MKRILITFLPLQLFLFAESQFVSNIDSAKLEAAKSPDSAKIFLYARIGNTYAFSQVDSSIAYSQKAIRLARKIEHKEGEAAGMASYGWALWAAGNYDKAIEAAFTSLNLYKELKKDNKIAESYSQLAVFYRDAGDYNEAMKNGMLGKNLLESLGDPGEFPPYTTLASILVFTSKIDSAFIYATKAYEIEKAGPFISGYTRDILGMVETKKKNYKLALEYFHAVTPVARSVKNIFDIAYTYSFVAELYQETGNIDSSIWYAKQVVNKPELSMFKQPVLNSLTILAHDYQLKNDKDSTLKYLQLRNARNDSMFAKEKTRAIQNLTFTEQLRQQEIEANKIQYQNKLKFYGVITLSGVFLLIGIILYRNNKLKQKANGLLQQQKQKVESTLAELKSAQAQLIHAEKMASLGELTAGIAHEIQNPLNFVNNFSELNGELLDEMDKALEETDIHTARNISGSVRQNLEKTLQHGKRADAIVKGMLQHSRSGSGQKETTDINALANEFLWLTFKGLRAKDNDFSANIMTEFDHEIGTVNIIPQDIGRVLVNLYNNAFYAVREKAKQSPDGYEPNIMVTTRRTNEMAEISVRDNGAGIPENIRQKIFQPFFTTKPAGQGTGLGLSLSYDIIKAHGGEIKVETKEGEFAEFVFQLPVV
jgi:signal transduction histidine kinase